MPQFCFSEGTYCFFFKGRVWEICFSTGYHLSYLLFLLFCYGRGFGYIIFTTAVSHILFFTHPIPKPPVSVVFNIITCLLTIGRMAVPGLAEGKLREVEGVSAEELWGD
jgi:hypothetical protein